MAAFVAADILVLTNSSMSTWAAQFGGGLVVVRTPTPLRFASTCGCHASCNWMFAHGEERETDAPCQPIYTDETPTYLVGRN